MTLISEYWFKFWFSGRSPHLLSLYRIIMFGSLSIIFLLTFDHAQLIYSCTLWNPHGIYSWLNLPCSEVFLKSIYYIGLCSSVFAAIGWRFRWTGFVAAVSAILFFGYVYNFHRVYHSFHMYLMVLLILSLSNASDIYSIDSLKKVSPQKSYMYNWPVQLSKLYVVYVYFICGLEKLYFRGLDWIFSDNLFLVIFTNEQNAIFKEYFLSLPLFVTVGIAFYSVIICELLAPIALVNRKWGEIFWFIWLSFHIGVYVSLGGHTFFLTQLIAASIFLLPRFSSRLE